MAKSCSDLQAGVTSLLPSEINVIFVVVKALPEPGFLNSALSEDFVIQSLGSKGPHTTWNFFSIEIV
jgi:hypothetical protein